MMVSKFLLGRYCALLLGFGGVMCLSTVTAIAQGSKAEESMIEIPLVPEATSNPRFKLNPPPSASEDKLELTANGLSIKQTQAGGSNAKTCGFNLDVQAKGGFALMLDYEVKRLESPKVPRVQGLWIRFVLENGDVPAIGLVSGPRMKRALGTAARHSEAPKLEMQLEPFSFTNGTWIIERQDKELRLSVGEASGSFRIVKRMPCPDAPLKEIQVWCSRYNSGNAPAEFLFKKVRFADTSLFVGRGPRRPWLSSVALSRLIYFGFMISACSLIGWYFYKKKIAV